MALSVNNSVRQQSDVNQRLVDMILKEEQKFVQSLKPLESDISGLLAGSFGTGGTSGGAPIGNFLKTQGDTMIGPLALNSGISQVIFSSGGKGHINIAQGTNAYSSSFIISDNLGLGLSFIDGAQFNGQLLILECGEPGGININNTGNIRPFGNVTFNFKFLDKILFQYSQVGGNKWIQITNSNPPPPVIAANLSLSNLVSPVINISLNMNNLDLVDVRTIFFKSTGSSINISTNGAGSVMDYFINGYTAFKFTVNSSLFPHDGIFQIFGQSSSTSIHPQIKLTNAATAGNTNTIGGVWFDGNQSNGIETSYAKITVKTDDVTLNNEFASIRFSVMTSGLLIEQMFLDNNGLNLQKSLMMLSSASITANTISINDGFNINVGTITGTKIGVTVSQKIGFWGKTPVPRQTVTGSKQANPALQSLLSALNTAGIITDSSSA